MQDHADRTDSRADPQRLDQRGTRLVAHLAILGRAVEQVHRVDQHRLDLGRPDRLAKLGEVVVGVRGWSPHPRRLVEDLDRFAAAIDAPLNRFGEATGI
jgi:hypothetical protein